MNPWSQQRIDAYAALADGGKLTDPKFAPHPDHAEARLKAVVQKHWEKRKDFPEWIAGYIAKWTAQKEQSSGR